MKTVIKTFYDAFLNLDAKTMTSCYHNAIVFEDPAFGILKGDRAKAMWHMLCESQKGKDFKVVVSNIEENTTQGFAQWEAFYTFSQTSRKVHNKIDAKFLIEDGLIIKHIDSFNLHNWARQAMGTKGLLIGRTRYFSNKLKSKTNYMLDNYLEEKKPLS